MDPYWMKELTTNNQAPSDEETVEVKRALLIPLQDLQNVDSEILDLKTRLSEIENKRNEMQKWLSPYTSILSPIRRIPPDLLGEIFWHCLPTHRNPIMKETECPLLLTRVCSTWRAAAMADPRLWAQIYITFTDADMVPDAEDVAAEAGGNEENAALRQSLALSKSEKDQATKTLRMKLDAVKEWLSRSGTMPLSISLCFTENFWPTTPYPQRPQQTVTMEFLSFLASLSRRFKDLELRMSIEIYRVLEKMMSISEMKTLSSLRLDVYCQIPQSDEDRSRPILLFGTENLRKISMSACDPRLWGIVNGPSAHVGWGAFTDISCHSSITILETKFMLEQCSNLIHFRAMISDIVEGNDISPGSPYQGHPISLPFLRTFWIIEYNNPRALGNLYASIHAPELKWIGYCNYFHLEPFSADNNTAIPIIPLLQNSTALKKLSFDGSDMSRLDITKILQAAPTITHLVLGPEQRSTTGKANLFTNAPLPLNGRFTYTPHSSSWKFDNLVAGGSREFSEEYEMNIPDQSGLNGEGHPQMTLLPRLESFEASSPHVHISDDILVKFVKSRLPPRATEDIATLRHVGIVFHRQKTRDAAEEIMQYAELAGAKIDLKLQYAKPYAPELKATSPEFGLGLRDSSGRSWTHQDAGEYEEWYL